MLVGEEMAEGINLVAVSECWSVYVVRGLKGIGG